MANFETVTGLHQTLHTAKISPDPRKYNTCFAENRQMNKKVPKPPTCKTGRSYVIGSYLREGSFPLEPHRRTDDMDTAAMRVI
jgi:hypothetical protein